MLHLSCTARHTRTMQVVTSAVHRDLFWKETVVDFSQRCTPAAAAVDTSSATPLLTVKQATLFMTDVPGLPCRWDNELADTLARVRVQAGHKRVVSLLEQPLLGRTCRVRVTPCLVLDTGSRLIHIPGDPLLLSKAMLEAALLQA